MMCFTAKENIKKATENLNNPRFLKGLNFEETTRHSTRIKLITVENTITGDKEMLYSYTYNNIKTYFHNRNLNVGYS